MIRSLAFLIAFASLASAADTGFVDKKFKNADGTESPYVVFVPHEKKDNPPIILFLHGAGETKAAKGKDGKAVKEGKMPKEVGIGPAIQKREKSFPFVVVIPRAEGFGWGADTENAKRAMKMLEATEKEYKTDPKRVYLTGLSMGGMGTWSNAAKHPDRWAAIVPICGRGDVATGETIKKIPTWAFHGDADKAVPVSGSRTMIEAMKKAGGEPKYTEYPGVEHNSWDKAYGTDELYEWLLKQAKK